jgi:hypothetical protein
MIKWKRLKRIAEEISGMDVDIHLTTSEDIRGYNALLNMSKGKADVYINGMNLKSEEQVVEGLGHELAHALLADSNHGEVFEKKRREIIKKLTDGYFMEV